uniref:Sodium/nucleoside cotransporter n=1 Tax=Phallusia mammillata TaxID=59560 RepID=A0A6F9DSQ2_9ASCI|nr:solute carrier family 28 member 3-like [Phallusia mammillata]
MNDEKGDGHRVEMEMCNQDVEKGEMEKFTPGSEESSSTNSLGKGDGLLNRILLWPVNTIAPVVKQHLTILKYMFFGLLIAAYFVYLIVAIVYDAHAAIPLIILTCVVLALVFYELFSKRFYKLIGAGIRNVSSVSKQRSKKALNWVILLGCLAFIVWLLVDILMRNPSQLVSLLGFVIILCVCFWGSKYPKHITWRPVIWGIAMQFIFGLLILRTAAGYATIKFVGDQVATFMQYTEYGSIFVFDNFKMHYFAFKVLPMIVFFSTVMNMLYYIGIMQWFIGKLAFLTQITLGTSAIESTVAIANIFVGMTEAPLVVRPYLADLTKAEIHSVLTAGLGSIAFSVFGVFVGFGVNSVHLLTACVMSAPASLVVSRMLFPEREKSQFLNTDSLKLQSGTDHNIVEAAAAGASMSIGLVANIAANLIAFLALLAFINATLSWFGAFVGIQGLSFEVICSYIFMPVAFLMGADWEDCFLVGQLFGMKTFLNEFIAFESMKPYFANRLNGTISKFDANGTLQFMSERSEVIATHALCGFCNISSLGIIVGGLSVLMPTRKTELAELALRALVGGMLTCCMTASIAGLLFAESDPVAMSMSTTMYTPLLNTTFPTNTT